MSDQQTGSSPTSSFDTRSTVIAILFAGLLVAGAVFYTQGERESKAGSESDPATLAVNKKTDHIRGAKRPDVYFVEYSDYQCPFCSQYHSTVQEIVDEFDGRVAWVYRHFPIDAIHPQARPAATAAECLAELAGEDAFWDFTDEVFAGIRVLDQSMYIAFAQEKGVSGEEFEECISSDRYDALLDTHMQQMLSREVGGTPYTVLLSKKGETLFTYAGAIPIERVRSLVRRALAAE